MSEQRPVLRLEELVASEDLGGVMLNGRFIAYADPSRWGAYERARVRWLWQRILEFEMADEEPTEELASRYEQHVAEALGHCLPGLPGEAYERLSTEAKARVLVDFFTRRRELQVTRAMGTMTPAEQTLSTGKRSSRSSRRTTGAPTRVGG